MDSKLLNVMLWIFSAAAVAALVYGSAVSGIGLVIVGIAVGIFVDVLLLAGLNTVVALLLGILLAYTVAVVAIRLSIHLSLVWAERQRFASHA